MKTTLNCYFLYNDWVLNGVVMFIKCTVDKRNPSSTRNTRSLLGGEKTQARFNLIHGREQQNISSINQFSSFSCH